MYHDQGQTPFKALTSISDDKGVRLTTGLPLVRTAPAHGTCFEQAGRCTMEAESMRHAIFMAIDIWRHRQQYDEPTGHPLPKLYHEKRDDSEKGRFNVPRERKVESGERKEERGERREERGERKEERGERREGKRSIRTDFASSVSWCWPSW